jgi:hypothetical protein
MNADCFYEMGYTHTVCEDYALAGKLSDTICYAIVCDGCSASDDVDVGARIMAYAALCEIKQTSWERVLKDPVISPTFAMKFYQGIAIRADLSRRQLGLAVDCLDSTLLIAIANDEHVGKVFMYGDGGVAVVGKEGNLVYRHVIYKSGAPYYLSYLLDGRKNDGYNATFGNKGIEIVTENLDDGEEKEWNDIVEPRTFQGVQTYGYTSFSFSDVKFVAVMSDGIHTYGEPELKEGFDIRSNPKVQLKDIPHGRMVEQFMGFKNTKGEFVKRRLNRVKRDCLSDHLYHYDDVSISAIFTL